MGISFGSVGKKPYVGSKEVQEAYVGNQLVYQSMPDTTYPPIVMNLGYTNLSYLSENNNKMYLQQGSGLIYPGKGTRCITSFTLPNPVRANVNGTITIDGVTYTYTFNQGSMTYKYLMIINIATGGVGVALSNQINDTYNSISAKFSSTVPKTNGGIISKITLNV